MTDAATAETAAPTMQSEVPSSAVTTRYEVRTPASKREWEAFRRHLPDGHTRDTAFFPPHPIVLVRGEGATVIDADGNSYYDLLNNYTSLVHGNAHPELAKAARSVIEGGTVFPSPHRLQAAHTRRGCASASRTRSWSGTRTAGPRQR